MTGEAIFQTWFDRTAADADNVFSWRLGIRDSSTMGQLFAMISLMHMLGDFLSMGLLLRAVHS